MPNLNCARRWSVSTVGRRTALVAYGIAFAAVAVTNSPAGASTPAAVYVDGAVATSAQAERNGRLFVPAHSVFKQLGASIVYRAPRADVTTTGGSKLAGLVLGSRTATLHGTPHTLDAAPFTVGGEFMVPLRFVSEAAGATVTYSAHPRAVHLTRVVAAAAAPAAAPQAQAATTAKDAAGAATAAAATAAATDAPAAQHGFPWWALVLAALVLAAVIFALMRRKKEPLIVTTSKVGAEPKIVTRH